MPIIPGVSADYSLTLSPYRIITVPIPIVDISIQDLHDTLRDIEDNPLNNRYSPLIKSEGKQGLFGPGEFVGITAILQQTVLSFAARPGPDPTRCIVSGGNLTAIDEVGGKLFPVFETLFTSVIIAQSSSPTSLDLNALTATELFTILNI